PAGRSVLRDGLSRQRASVRRHAVCRRGRLPRTAGHIRHRAPVPRSERNVCSWTTAGIRTDEHLRYTAGGGVHVRDVHDRPPHGGPPALGLLCRLRVRPGAAPGHYRIRLDRVLLFPCWVLLVSTWILIADLH